MILTVDFGTSVTKVALWGERGLVTLARAVLTTTHPHLGWAEQDPFGWWTSVVIGCAEARAAAPAAFASVDVVSCSAARQTFVPVTSSADPLGKGLLWSDRRAGAEAIELTERLGGDEAVRTRTGVPLDSGAMAAKVAWLATNQPDRLAASDWLLSPRDLVLWRLTGEVATDVTLASRTGLYDLCGSPVPEIVGPAAGRLAPVVLADHVIGMLRSVPAAELGLRPGTPVVIGAGDRQCEVLGSGATVDCPMVSWGTTANISFPVDARPDPSPAGMVISRGAGGGWLVEGGLSSAGAFLGWLGELTGRDPESLAALASVSPPGARGVVAVPWLDGARAPWWRDDARGGLVGLSSAHDTGDAARAVVESVAWDVVRCLESVHADIPGAPDVTGLCLAGAGSRIPLWVEVLTSVTGLPATRRCSGEAASAGAALLGAGAIGMDVLLDQLDPVEEVIVPDPVTVASYRGLRTEIDRVTAALLDLGLVSEGAGGVGGSGPHR
ncbi:MAG: xylulokinase [Acidimicrobiales bacterium]